MKDQIATFRINEDFLKLIPFDEKQGIKLMSRGVGTLMGMRVVSNPAMPAGYIAFCSPGKPPNYLPRVQIVKIEGLEE